MDLCTYGVTLIEQTLTGVDEAVHKFRAGIGEHVIKGKLTQI